MIGGKMNTYIYINKKEKINDIQFEVVETKGKGHPDNICDTLAEKYHQIIQNIVWKNMV